MIRKMNGVLFLLVLTGCGNTPWWSDSEVFVVHDPDRLIADSANIGGVEIENGNVSVPGNLIVDGDGDFEGAVTAEEVMAENDVIAGDDVGAGDDVVGQDIVDLPPPSSPPDPPSPPPSAPEPEPGILTATISESNRQTTFTIGESINLMVIVAGSSSPYDLRCLWPDGQFTVINDSSVSRFEFSRAIGSPGSGTINCRVTGADGQEANVWYTLIIE